MVKIQMDKRDAEQADLKEKMDKNSSSLAEFTDKITINRQDITKKKSDIEVITKEIEQKGEQDQVHNHARGRQTSVQQGQHRVMKWLLVHIHAQVLLQQEHGQGRHVMNLLLLPILVKADEVLVQERHTPAEAWVPRA